ncbi:MAG: MMPL family transporter [Nakamurella sp.]
MPSSPDPQRSKDRADVARPPAPSRKKAVLRALGVLGVIAVWLGIAGAGGPAIGSLSTVQSNDQATFLPAGAESVEAADAAAVFRDNDSLPAFVVFAADGVASADQLAGWQAFAAGLAAVPVVLTAPAGGTAPAATVGDYLLAPQVPLVPSADGVAALVVVPLNAALVTAPDEAGKPPLTAVIDALRAAAVADARGAQAHVAGPAGLISDLGAAFGGIDGLLLLVALGAVLVILFAVYRAVALPFVVLFTSVSALALAGGVVYLLAKNGVLDLNGQSQGILFILVVGAATDYALLLVARYREELERTESKYTAISRAWRACVQPIAASAGTVVIGLLCLLLSNLNSNKTLGPVGAIGIVAALIGALTLLPALLMAGRWLFWPRIPHVVRGGRHEPDAVEHPIPAGALVGSGEGRPAHHHAAAEGPAGSGQAGPPAKPGVWGRVAVFVDRYPRRIWIVTAIVLAVACLAVPTLKASGTAQTDIFLTDVDSIAGTDELVAHFPGGSGNPIVIVAPESARQEVLTALASVSGLAADPVVVTAAQTGPIAPTDPLVVGGRIQIQATPTAAADSEEAQQAVRDVRAVVHALPGGDQILVGGNTAIQLDTVDTAKRDLTVIIPAILLAVLIVLILLLRSVVAALLLVAATVLSFGTALGVAALVFNHVLDFPGSDPSVPLFGFVFLVALGIDYSIFLMTRAREEVAVHGPRQGVLSALRVTGGVITSAGIVLAATFAALAVIPILFLAQIAFIVAFGVLLDTLIVRTLLVPALAVDLGRRMWWPVTPKPTRHQRELIAAGRLEVDAEMR